MVEKLVTLNGVKDKLQAGVCQMIMNTCSPHLSSLTDDERRLIVARVVVNHDIVETLHRVYSEHFTADEMLDMISFFKSPTGKKYCKVQDDFANSMMAATGQFASKASIDVIKQGFKASLDKTIRDNEADPEKPVE